MHSYQYVILRFVPRVDRGEFVNIGVVVHCQELDLLACRWSLDEARIRALAPRADLESLRAALAATDTMCDAPTPDVLAALPTVGKRFGWIAAPRSTAVQPGPIHGGCSADPAAELELLLRTQVELG